MNLSEIIRSARGLEQADLVLTNARIVNVFSGEIISGSVAVAGGYIAGFGDYPAKKKTDLRGDICPRVLLMLMFILRAQWHVPAGILGILVQTVAETKIKAMIRIIMIYRFPDNFN